MFRKALIAAVIAMIVAPVAILAQSQLSASAISGRAIDAAGRGVGSQRVELVQGNHIVATSQTSALGEWSFSDVKPGEYIVRMNIMGRLTGVHVSVFAGQVASGTLIIVSTASVSPQLGGLASLLTVLPTAVTAATTAAVAAGVETETTELNDEILEQILTELAATNPAAAVAFATAVLNAIVEAGGAFSPFSSYVTELMTIIESGGTTIPNFKPPAPQVS